MASTNGRHPTRPTTRLVIATAAGLAVASCILGPSCDSDAQAVFRQTATGQIGEGVKQFLGGDAETAVDTIVTATVDGLVAGIQQAGRGPQTTSR